MPSDFNKVAFFGGEISPQLYGRSDLETYGSSVGECVNFFVDYRGGLSNRPGSEFGDYVATGNARLIPFEFAPGLRTTFALLFTDSRIRFIQDNSYIIESGKTITAVTQDVFSPKITIAAHGYVAGDLIKISGALGMVQLNGLTLEVDSVVDANNFTVGWPSDAEFGGVGPISTSTFPAYTGGGSAYRVYTVASPYVGADIPLIRAYQSKSVVYLAHHNYAPRALTRVSNANWTFSSLSFASSMTTPVVPTGAASTAGTAGVAFRITAVDANGEESEASDVLYMANIVDYSSTAGSVKLTWSRVAGAIYYNIYRTAILAVSADVTAGSPFGLIGRSYGKSFTDRNIIPDFTRQPPTFYNPFANGAIRAIDVTNDGSAYTRASVISAGGGGSGFKGSPIVDGVGNLQAVLIRNGGAGYTTPTIAATVGTGATFSVTASPMTGNYPAALAIFQQRLTFGGTDNEPLSVFLSRPGLLNNFGRSLLSEDDDGLEFEIDAPNAAPIRHLVATRSGLLIMTQTGMWQLNGGDTAAVSPTAAAIDPQTATGASELPPLAIGPDLIYREGKGTAVRLLEYTSDQKVFTGTDLSIYAGHLLPVGIDVVSWTWAEDPFKLLHLVREDGIALMMTFQKEQKLYGWSRNYTRGYYQSMIAIQENSRDSIYQVVRRPITGALIEGTSVQSQMNVFERVAPREFVNAEDAWFVDCGLQLAHTYPNFDVNVSAIAVRGASGATVDLTCSPLDAGFGAVGNIVRFFGGVFEVTTLVAPYFATLTILEPIKSGFPAVIPTTETLEQNYQITIDAGDWSLDTPVSTVSGLRHLAGCEVVGLADGDVIGPLLVDGTGSITLPEPSTSVVVGLYYPCRVAALPPTSSDGQTEGKPKRPTKVLVRMYKARGLKAGDTLERLEEIPERGYELYGNPTELRTGIEEVSLDATYEVDSQVWFVQDYPLPVTLVGAIIPMDISNET